MQTVNCEQRSPEWYQIKCGVPGSSSFDKIVTTKGEPSKSRTKYMYQLAGERIIGHSEETYQSLAMQRGIEMEAEARKFYEMVTDSEVQEVGFCFADSKYKYGASPDGLVGDKGVLEIKCPILSTHVEYLLQNKFPMTYWQQVQGQLMATKREWVDFVSYYPGIRPLIVRVARGADFIMKLKIELELFCEQLEELTIKLK